jgi:hypothetical protein
MLARAIQQPAAGDVQSNSQPVDYLDRRVPRAALQIADVGPVQPDLEGKGLLREPARLAQLAQVQSKALTNIHAGQVGAMSMKGLQTMSDIEQTASYEHASGVDGAEQHDRQTGPSSLA